MAFNKSFINIKNVYNNDESYNGNSIIIMNHIIKVRVKEQKNTYFGSCISSLIVKNHVSTEKSWHYNNGYKIYIIELKHWITR